MRMAATEVGFFEDFEDEEALEVAIGGVDEAGVRRSFSIQRSTYEPVEQEIQFGMDSYNVSTERGFTAYGCLCNVELPGYLLTMEFSADAAEALEIPALVELDLSATDIEEELLVTKLRDVLDWGNRSKRPSLIGLGIGEWPGFYLTVWESGEVQVSVIDYDLDTSPREKCLSDVQADLLRTEFDKVVGWVTRSGGQS